MRLKIEIAMDNAAFEDSNGSEAGRILERLATIIRDENLTAGELFPLRDEYGNNVGEAEVCE